MSIKTKQPKQEVREVENVKEMLQKALLPTVCGVIGSFIGIAIAYLLGIL